VLKSADVCACPEMSTKKCRKEEQWMVLYTRCASKVARKLGFLLTSNCMLINLTLHFYFCIIITERIRKRCLGMRKPGRDCFLSNDRNACCNRFCCPFAYRGCWPDVAGQSRITHKLIRQKENSDRSQPRDSSQHWLRPHSINTFLDRCQRLNTERLGNQD